MKKPNVFWHMIHWGFGGGTVLSLLYAAIYFNDVSALFSPLIWFYAAMYAGFGGAFLGLVDAIFLRFLLRERLIPVPQATRLKVYFLTSVLTFIGGMVLTSWLWLDIPSRADGSLMRQMAIYPSLIAASAATYASHRYLFRLRRYYKPNSKEKRKGKPKYDMSRLEDSGNIEEGSILEAENDLMQRQEE